MEEWGPWIEHTENEKPAHLIGKYIGVVGSVGNRDEAIVMPDPPGTFSQFHVTKCKFFGYEYVVRYRIRKPRALQELRDLVENLPVREDA